MITMRCTNGHEISDSDLLRKTEECDEYRCSVCGEFVCVNFYYKVANYYRDTQNPVYPLPKELQ